MSDAVLVERQGPVAIVTLNLPDKRNSLVNELVTALAHALAALQEDRACRAIVLSGGKHFCAGGSLDGLSTDPLAMRADMRDGHRVIRLISAGRIPVVAAVEGAAFGAGLSLAAACDFVVADARTKFGAVFGKVGIMPDWGSLWMLPQRIGLRRTRELTMLAQVVDGKTAVDIGLADLFADEGQVMAVALERARLLAEGPAGAIGATKSFLARFPLPLDALLDWEADTQALLIASADFAEGKAAFFEKRAPDFLR